ncbi:4Fe-4S binding protein [Puniceibacterium sediminis]|uniref:4Fe-4S dicluster domain-containing protein n=1 Tax=Puniceibacterium sediminis TaxID=1608407 RepID=A0A238XTN8_9RHOB|nr:4Fe-4S binding protein [Puniceibacterium sediminis]SNR62072.1 4Fe-4S dicluster domain-containing protein [Puniceibacterium sediminis]
MAKTLLLCDCLGSQTVDAEAIGAATGLACTKVYTGLCQHQSEQAATALNAGDVIVACQQERPFFEALAEELGADAPGFVDLRDRAGWTVKGTNPTPKMAALAAEAALVLPAARSLDILSEGTCLILGAGEVAFATAANLCDQLAVTVLQTDGADAPMDRRFDVIRGRLGRAQGALGGFNLRIDAFQQLLPGGRGLFEFSVPRDGAVSECDIILDLTSGTPLFPAPEKREGYLRADPRQPIALAQAASEAAQMVGTFEKPLYVRLEESLCAHSRAEQTGCSKCLNICPTGAITSAGEHVAIDPMICAGCGACSALCPSGAITYDAPPVSSVFRRLDTLSGTYRRAGGRDARLLVHDDHGAEMIRLSARFGNGLPGDVIPLQVEALAGFGHAEMLAALSCGFASVDVLLAPRTERDTPEFEMSLANAVAGRAAVALLDMMDPDALSEHLYSAERAQSVKTPVLPIGTRRQVTRVAAKALNPAGVTVSLPPAAPYGAVLVNKEACTLCLSCVSLCPSGALGDNEDKPQLLFQEDACLQCGICATICPEKAIELQPQLDLSDSALSQRVLHEEEPFPCIECGGLFGVKSTVEKVVEKLAGKHAMFANEKTARMIQMCDKCRIEAQYHSENNPFAMGTPRRVRTTDDYLNEGPSKRKDH